GFVTTASPLRQGKISTMFSHPRQSLSDLRVLCRHHTKPLSYEHRFVQGTQQERKEQLLFFIDVRVQALDQIIHGMSEAVQRGVESAMHTCDLGSERADER